MGKEFIAVSRGKWNWLAGGFRIARKELSRALAKPPIKVHSDQKEANSYHDKDLAHFWPKSRPAGLVHYRGPVGSRPNLV